MDRLHRKKTLEEGSIEPKLPLISHEGLRSLPEKKYKKLNRTNNKDQFNKLITLML
jgi:hypothetical protein